MDLAATIYADGMLYMYTTDGMFRLVKAVPPGYDCVSECHITLGNEAHWVHRAGQRGTLSSAWGCVVGVSGEVVRIC